MGCKLVTPSECIDRVVNSELGMLRRKMLEAEEILEAGMHETESSFSKPRGGGVAQTSTPEDIRG